MAVIYVADIRPFIANDLMEKAMGELDETRFSKVSSLKGELPKARSLCCGLLLQYYVRGYLGINEKVQIKYRYGVHGKPCFDGIEGYAGLCHFSGLHHSDGDAKDGVFENICFSLSHSGDYAAMAVSREDVGLDIQIIKPINEAMARRVLDDREYGHYSSILDDDEKLKYFFDCWSQKEAYGKLIGSGLAGGLEVGDCIMRHYNQIKGYSMCLAMREEASPSEIADISHVALTGALADIPPNAPIIITDDILSMVKGI